LTSAFLSCDSSTQADCAPSPAVQSSESLLRDKRVICSIDLDCFYAQCEELRNPSLKGKPVGVQQKHLIITSNYAARAHGIKKGDSLPEVMRKCPSITICNGEDLCFYREISTSIFKIVSRWTPKVQRLGLDEFFADITELVTWSDTGARVSVHGMLFPDTQPCTAPWSAVDPLTDRCASRLALGSKICAEIRAAIFSEMGLTTSGGVSVSKLLSKMVASANKPDKQTVFLPTEEALEALMPASLGVNKVPGIGFATTQRLKDAGIPSIGALVSNPRAAAIGDKQLAQILNLCRGVCDAVVERSGPPKTVGGEQSFWSNPLTSYSRIPDVMRHLLGMVLVKVRGDDLNWGPRPASNIVVTCRQVEGTRISRQQRVPVAIRCKELYSPTAADDLIDADKKIIELLIPAAIGLLKKALQGAPVNINILNVALTFEEQPTTSSVLSFCKTKPRNTVRAAARPEHLLARSPMRPSVGGTSSASQAPPPVGSENRPAEVVPPSEQVETAATQVDPADDVSEVPTECDALSEQSTQCETDNEHAGEDNGIGQGSMGLPDCGPSVDIPVSSVPALECGAPTDDGIRNSARSGQGLKDDRVAQFFDTSRLSFIGSWKGRFRSFMKRMLVNRPHDTVLATELDALPSAGDVVPMMMHVDVDCFFVAVALRDKPDLMAKPVAVCSGRGDTSEVCSGNYAAREYGIKNGMFVGSAKKLCPSLLVVQTSAELFAQLAETAEVIYALVLQITHRIQPLSCDEMFLQFLPGDKYGSRELRGIAEVLAAAVKRRTGCKVSIGIGHNDVVARIACKKAKPPGPGVFTVPPYEAATFLMEQPVRALTGIGRRAEERLAELGVVKCADACKLGEDQMKATFGDVLGPQVMRLLHGESKAGTDTILDVADVANTIPKSLANEWGFGVRLTNRDEAVKGLRNVCEHVVKKLQTEEVVPGLLSLSLRIRFPDAPEPVKKGGQGPCFPWSKSVKLSPSSASLDGIHAAAVKLLNSSTCLVTDIRAMGVSLSKLQPAKDVADRPSILRWTRPSCEAGASASTEDVLPAARGPVAGGEAAGAGSVATQEVGEPSPKRRRLDTAAVSASDTIASDQEVTPAVEPVAALVQMGFDRQAAAQALEEHHTMDAAVEALVAGPVTPQKPKRPPSLTDYFQRVHKRPLQQNKERVIELDT